MSWVRVSPAVSNLCVVSGNHSMRVESFDAFVAMHPRFTVYGPPNWVDVLLQRAGRLALLGEDDGRLIARFTN
jgi:hypothetical protein